MWIVGWPIKWLAVAILSLNVFLANAQTDIELAETYFQKGECEKATTYYQKILRKDFNKLYLRRYISCQQKLKNTEDTEKFLKRQSKNDEQFGYLYIVYWGKMLERNGKINEAEQKYAEAITSIKPQDIYAYKELSDEFKEIENQNEAINALLKARMVSGNESIYKMELAALYAQTGKTELMIEELLNLGMTINNKEAIQVYLQDFLREEKDQQKLEKILYDKIQIYPTEPFYAEMLIWYHVQKKQFNRAFIQERALDKRYKYNGIKVFDLANLSLQNKDYEAATKAYDYVVKEYPQGQLYPYARRMGIVAHEEQIKNTFPIEKLEVRKLVSDYRKLLEEIGSNERTLEAMRSMALLYGFYLDEKDTAIVMLQSAVALGRNDNMFIDKCKLDLGDIHLLKNEPWESTLLYSQVEKSQRESTLGYEAKLKNARLNYYKGDFTLAKEILDILKIATTREIANDAEALSLLIQDNTGLDTSESAMREYAAIDLLLYQNKNTEALEALDKLFKKDKTHPLADEILWLKAKVYAKMGENEKVIDNLKQIIEKYGQDILADDAVFMLADTYQNKTNDKEKAMEQYQFLLEKYPASMRGVEARKRYRQLRGDAL